MTWGKKHEANLQRERIIALRTKDPELSAAAIATRLGCTRSTVDRVLAEHAKGIRRSRATPEGVKAYSNPITGQYVVNR